MFDLREEKCDCKREKRMGLSWVWCQKKKREREAYEKNWKG